MKKISILLIVVMCLGFFAGCGKTGGQSGGGGQSDGSGQMSGTKTYRLEEIGYKESLYEKRIDDTYLNVTVPTKEYFSTGEKIEVTSKIKANKIWKKQGGDVVAGAVYYIVDWGDGTWSYNGPGVQSDTMKSAIVNSHVYKKAGTYYISSAAYCMQTDEYVGWSDGKKITVKGDDIVYGGLMNNLKPVSSASYSAANDVEKITDGDSSTYFRSAEAEDAYDEQYAGYLFDDIYTLNKIEIQIPSEADIFPSNIAVEYTTDNGKTWQFLPKYYYLYDYAKGIFNPIMRFPNPKGATLVLDLDGIVANGIRLVSKLTSVALNDMAKEKTLYVSEMRVYGSRRTLLYTSMGSTFDADLNNMWTIYGSAKTEPNLTGNQLSSATNQSPFRTGHAIIGSTEWLEWCGLKYNWTNYDAARELCHNYLKSTRTGSDGWSNDDGYVWATANGQYHLDMGAHYTYNSIFVMAARNYLLQGNNVGEYDENGNYIPFMDMTNALGQTMRERLTKAMNYMLKTLDGEKGVLVIKDPKNQGLAGAKASVASNYWDAMTAFGYISSYENIFFYESIKAYADILEYFGEDSTYYRNLEKLVKEKFNETFWDRTKKRYITSINSENVTLDFGVTYVNFMAVAAGLADDIKAEAIYAWVDGERIIAGDTSTGDDIYGAFKFSARGNTLDVSKVTDKNGQWYWWYNAETMSPAAGLGAYGNQMQNGGTIFYTSYYDLLGRSFVSADNSFARFKTIMDEFHIDSLRRNPRTYYGEYVAGVLGEFPESGLVPYTFISNIVGLNATVKGLEIKSALPSEMEFAGVSEYLYGNRTYSIKVDKRISVPKVEKYDDGTFFVTVPADGVYYITLDNRLVKR